MKMVKSLLLGSAAGLIAVAGAQAADLPVKAKPVQYVKICTLYGDGFYYIPGSDTCLKVFGYVRADYGYNVHTNVVHYSGDQGARDRHPNRHPFTTRHRLNWSADARTQTAYGTLRAYTSLHVENRHDTEEGVSSVNIVNVTPQRAFIQWAGFTFGHINSFADVPGQMGDSGFRSLHQFQTESTTGANGLNQIAYSFDLGSGARLTVGADERRVKSLWNATGTTPATLAGTRIGGTPTTARTGQYEHSPFISLLVNQAWGTAGVAVIAQQNRAVYYTPAAVGTVVTAATAVGCPIGAQAGTTECAHPDDKWGWGARAGAEFKFPMFGPGDRLLISGYYSEGSTSLTGQNTSSPSLFGDRSVALGWVSDAAYVNGGQFQNTTAWSINAGYEHYWTPAFSNALYGGYIEFSYNDTVINNRWFCGSVQTVPATRTCDPGFSLYHIGFLTNWFPAPGFRLALDVLYTGIDTALAGPITIASARGLRPTGAYTAKDRGITSVMFRAQRNWGGGD
jgi:hypothetical protein